MCSTRETKKIRSPLRRYEVWTLCGLFIGQRPDGRIGRVNLATTTLQYSFKITTACMYVFVFDLSQSIYTSFCLSTYLSTFYLPIHLPTCLSTRPSIHGLMHAMPAHMYVCMYVWNSVCMYAGRDVCTVTMLRTRVRLCVCDMTYVCPYTYPYA